MLSCSVVTSKQFYIVLMYSWRSCTFRCWVCPGLWFRQWLKFRHNWDLQSSPEWCSWIWMRSTLASCDTLWMSHSSSGMPQLWQSASEVHVPHFIVHLLFWFASFSSRFLWLWFSGRCSYRLSSHKTLHIQVQPAHPACPLLIYQSLPDGYEKAPPMMPWTVSSVSTVHWRKVPLHC